MKTLLLILLMQTTIVKAFEVPKLKAIKAKCSTETIIKRLPASYALKVNNVHHAINKITTELDVNPCLVLSMVWTESTFKPSARSNKGAHGLMQLMPRTKRAMQLKMEYELNRIITMNLDSGLNYDEIENLVIGTFYVKKLLKKFHGNTQHAIMAYNAGPTWITINIKNRRKIGSNNKYLNKVNSNLRLVTVN